ncbi:hypothetical protein CDAR_371571 [Caerostris darwini]|uniref:Uncharacterized protein n=1 Tax=Caerostris darwini TaxID=1538125 RepID=A0AAV4X813_9ARAC|nr:hypothetical protein CDAR_371571 [Caerostris darwini]
MQDNLKFETLDTWRDGRALWWASNNEISSTPRNSGGISRATLISENDRQSLAFRGNCCRQTMHFAGRVVFEKEQVRCLKIVRRDSGVLPACLRSRKNEEVRKQSSFLRLRPKSCLSTVTQGEEKKCPSMFTGHGVKR